MFSLRNFIRRGLLDAVGKQPDYWVILNAAGWLDKSVLLEADLLEIQQAIDAKNAPQSTVEPSGATNPSEETEPAGEN